MITGGETDHQYEDIIAQAKKLRDEKEKALSDANAELTTLRGVIVEQSMIIEEQDKKLKEYENDIEKYKQENDLREKYIYI